MLKTRSAVAGWIALTGMVGGFSVLFLLEWRISRDERHTQSVQLVDALRRFERRLDLALGEESVLLRSLQAGQDSLRSEIARVWKELPRAEESSVVTSEPAPELTTVAAVETPEVLPPVPEGVHPQTFFRDRPDIEAVLADARFNPDQRELTRVERFKVWAEVTRSRARLDVLDAELHASVNEGMERLREHGEFVEYDKGEKYAAIAGVLSAAEELPNERLRMFYLYPPEFPEIYEKRKEREAVAESGVRRLRSMLEK